ncbi:MAG TPA: hypothetical protein VFS44_09140 [Gemmatimonadaceae bacterium]|nr:hypothetical protein [Gemmatimonadaceae bacterium]
MPMTSLSSIALPSHRRTRAGTRGARFGLAVFLAAATLSGCSPEKLAGNDQLPPNVPDPGQTATPAGAIAAYHSAIVQLRTAFGGHDNSFVPVTGLLTDELRSGDVSQPNFTTDPMLVDSRFMPEDPGIGDDSTTPFPVWTVYGLLQKARGQARQARGALLAYAPDSSRALVGALNAIEGYADVLLADLFCSGVPLSTLDFGGDFTYQPGSSTEEVYQHAIAFFDSALAVSADSERVMNLARVGKGRALLALGRYAEAAQAVADVPDDFRYTFDFSATAAPNAINGDVNRMFAYHDFGLSTGPGMATTMVDTEGVNGLSYIGSGDPRTAWVSGAIFHGLALVRPASYPTNGSGSLVLASGVEARLIQAEAALQAGGAEWLAMLNALRTDGTFDTRPDSADSTKTDTLWHAGTGGVAGLAPLADPGSPDARVSLLFQERAYWLFLTGHRQGDLRRLIRDYGRDPERVYPTGTYPGAFDTYGGDVTAPIPGTERVSNPLFTGCRSRGA